MPQKNKNITDTKIAMRVTREELQKIRDKLAAMGYKSFPEFIRDTFDLVERKRGVGAVTDSDS